ncbi:MAG TPA: hypothetical protein VJN95_01825 [Gemmatimonadales bacterium]|nr:hypothetical protein [Gemmatimonadales bacterium]
MTTHRRAALVALVLCLLSASSLAAQFGGLKKKAAQAAGAATGVAPANTPGKATPPPEVTPVIVDHYLAGIKAGEAERARLAQGNTPAGQYYAAVDAKKKHDKYCAEYQEKQMAEYQRLIAAAKYDSSALVMQKKDPSCQTYAADPKEPSFDELAKAKGSQDSAAAAAAGVDVSQWAGLNEWIPVAVYQMVNSPDQNDQLLASNFSKKVSEISALRARQADLATALNIRGPERQKKEAPAAMAAPAAPAAGAAGAAGTQGDANCYSTEMQKNQPALEALGKRAEAAQKKGDNASMMAIADTIQQLTSGAMKKCGMMK